jgi:hypothetical protein
MTWQDLNPFLTGAGPDATVFDSGGTATTLLSAAAGGSVQVQWSFTGSAVALLGDIQFTATLYADPLGPASSIAVDSSLVAPVSPTPTAGPVDYSTTIVIPPGTLLADSVYEFTVVITAGELASGGTTTPLPIAGFFDGPLVAVTA